VRGATNRGLPDQPLGGALPALYIAYLGVRHTVERITLEEPDDVLFTKLHDTHDHWECPDAWPHSEAGRFHRGISLLLVALALLLLVAEGACHHGPKELALLALLAIGALAARWLARDFRAHPAGFPEPTPGHGLRMMATDADGQPLGSSSDPLGR
jgi:hypothetical protein